MSGLVDEIEDGIDSPMRKPRPDEISSDDEDSPPPTPKKHSTIAEVTNAMNIIMAKNGDGKSIDEALALLNQGKSDII